MTPPQTAYATYSSRLGDNTPWESLTSSQRAAWGDVAEAVGPRGGLTAAALLGILLIVAGEVLSYVVNGALGTSIAGLGTMLLASSPALISARTGRVGTSVLIVLLSTLGGCAASQYLARKDAAIEWTPGPPCHIEVHLDGQPKPAVTVDAPDACEPPADLCPVAPPAPAPLVPQS